MYNKIQFKIIALITLVTVFFILGLLSLRNSESKNISMLLKDRVSEKDTIIRKIIYVKSKPLRNFVYDYSYWDELLAFANSYPKNKDEKWAYDNLITTFHTYEVNAAWIYDEELNLVYTSNNINQRTFKELPLSKDDFKSIISKNLFAHFFINTNAGLMEISVAPLQPSYDNERITHPQGFFMAGRLWTDDYLDDLSKLTSSKISLITNLKDTIIDDDIKTFEFFNDVNLQDWNGANLVKLRAVTESAVIEKFFDYSYYLFIGTVLFIILIIILISMYLFKNVNVPLKSITSSLEYGNTEYIRFLLNKKNEFGDISRLIAESFKNKESLLSEIAMRKTVEQELIKAKEKAEELNILKSNLLANLSHEFRTPLSGIIGLSELLSDEIVNKEQLKLINDIMSSGKRLNDTLNSILLLAQFESSEIILHKEKINIANEIRNYFEKFKYKTDEKNLTLKIVIEDISIFVETDKELLRQVFYNLFDNAVKFTDKGSVTVRLYSLQDADGFSAAVDIADTGIGISDKYKGHIFDDFRQVSEGYTRKYEGTGLGLTLTKKVLNLLNGSVKFTSIQGKGSTFTVTIPAFKEDKIGILKEDIDESIKEKHKLMDILFVEDNPSNQFVFQKFLTDHAVVKFASSDAETFNILNKRKFDLIFLDINLGLGMDGIQIAQEIRKMDIHKDVPLIALTGYALEKDREFFLSNGFDYFVVKPFGKNDLLNVLYQFKKVKNI